MPPSPPAPFLMIFERSVSAGWLMMAAATPATTPDASETPRLPIAGGLSGDDPSRRVDVLGGLALHRELGHGVGDLLAEDRHEAGVERADEALLGHHLRRAADHGVGVGRVGDQPDAARLVGTEENVRDELGHGAGREVDRVAVVPGFLFSHTLRDVDLEELDAAELEPALDEVALGRRAEAGQKAVHALGLDHLPKPTNEALIIDVRLQLDLRFDDVDGHEPTVRDRAADAARQGTAQEVLHVKGPLAHDLVGRHGGPDAQLASRP